MTFEFDLSRLELGLVQSLPRHLDTLSPIFADWLQRLLDDEAAARRKRRRPKNRRSVELLLPVMGHAELLRALGMTTLGFANVVQMIQECTEKEKILALGQAGEFLTALIKTMAEQFVAQFDPGQWQ